MRTLRRPNTDSSAPEYVAGQPVSPSDGVSSFSPHPARLSVRCYCRLSAGILGVSAHILLRFLDILASTLADSVHTTLRVNDIEGT